MKNSPLLAMLLVVSTVRGTSVAFHWPAIIRRGKHHSHVRYYSSTDGELVHEDEAKSRSNVASDSDDVLSDSMSASSEDSFNEEAARIGFDDEESAFRDSSSSRMVRDSSLSRLGYSPTISGSSRARSQTRHRSARSPDARPSSGRSQSVSRASQRLTHSYTSNASHTNGDEGDERVSPYTSLLGFELGMLASFLIPRREQCHQRFEMTIDDLTFLGHPVTQEHVVPQSKTIESTIFNVVMVLDRSNMYPSVRCIDSKHWLQLYYTILFKLTAMLAWEEARVQYVSEQAHLLVQMREDYLQNGSNFHEYLKASLNASSLAQTLRDIQRSIARRHNIDVLINENIGLTLKLPQLLQEPNKAERAFELQPMYDMHDSVVQRGDLPEPRDLTNPLVRPYASSLSLPSILQEWSRTTGPFLLPWKTLLLPEEAFLPYRQSSIFKMAEPLTHMFCPSPQGCMTFAQAAEVLQWDLYKDVYPMVRHLIYYADAQVIDVPRIQSLYAINPTFDTHELAGLSERWTRQFPRMMSLPEFLTIVSSSLRPFVSHCVVAPREYAPIDILIWLLRQNVLTQLHVYLRLLITARDQLRAVDLRRERRERQLARKHRAAHSVDAPPSSDQEMLIDRLRAQMEHGLNIPQRPAKDPSHANSSHATSRASSTSSIDDWPSGRMHYSGGSDYFHPTSRNELDMDLEEDRFDDLLPGGRPHPIIIQEPARANRTESEWISALFDGKHPWHTRWLIRLFPYLNGKHNVDEIIAREKIRRRDLKSIISEFDANLLHFYHP